jgi:alanyl aminopeptidase
MKKHIIGLPLFAFFIFTSCISLRQGAKLHGEKDHPSIRLTEEVVPSRYNLTLWASPEKDQFSGQVSIDLHVKSERKNIILHGQNLDVQSAVLKNGNVEYKGVYKNLNEDGFAIIEFDQIINAGPYQLEINYIGHYQEDLMGLYRVKEGGESYLYTQFEPLSARKMLPCFDEPKFKAQFKLKVIADTKNTVIANAALESTVIQGQNTVHIFQETKPISTYLLALAVGPFDVVEGKNLAINQYRANAINFRGIATKGKGHKLAMAMRETPLIVERLENYFGVAYPFDKLDILAVPDFRSGAMENVGAITFREFYLLLNEESASTEQKHLFYLVMAHELSHQWFGNTVTMAWWDDIWLNEAFATWISHKIIDNFKPEFKSAANLLEQAHYAMKEDSLLSARKIREPIRSTHDIHSAFDSITYSKGGGVLSMLENYLGPEKFQKAVSDHIKRFSYATATSKDFLESLAKYADPLLVKSTETFLNQTGVPTVELSYGCKENGFKVVVQQKRFVPIGSKVEADRIWNIPMCIGYESAGSLKKHCFNLDKKVTTFDIKKESCPAFVTPNVDGQGYYRFSMNLADWQTLLSAPKAALSEADRLAIADSLVGELESGRLDFAFVAESLRGMLSINSSMLSHYFIELVKSAEGFWVSAENRAQLMEYAKLAIWPMHKELQALKDPSADQKVLKRDILSFLADTLKDPSARQELTTMGTGFLLKAFDPKKPEFKIDESLLGDAIAIALQHQEDAYLHDVVGLFSKEDDTVIRNSLLRGLAHAREATHADFVRSFAFLNTLRKNETLGLFFSHLRNAHNQPATWNFFTSHFDDFASTLTKSQMGNLPYLAQGLCSVESAAQVNKFFQPIISEYEGGPRTLAEVVESIEICAGLKEHASVLTNLFFAKDEEVAEKP